jgi:hypothetical protein
MPGPEQNIDVIQFLYDKRLSFFQTRQDHEWKIYFGAMAFFGACDATLVTGRMVLSGWRYWVWALACTAVLYLVYGYERDLQKRNGTDRDAMHELYECLCDSVAFPSSSMARENRPQPESRWVNHFLLHWILGYKWAFKWQMLFMILVWLISCALPWMLSTAARQPCFF